jgi:ABC-2 type transport system permease protein
VITAAVSASSVFGQKHHPAVILASAVFGTAFVGIFYANSAGLTGPAFVLEATALGGSRDLRAYFSGQNLVLCVIGAPLVVAVCFVLAAVARDPGMGVEATPVVLAGIGAALGLGNLFTAALPYPMVRRAGTPMPLPAPGYSGYRLGGLITLAGTAVLAAPVIVGAVLTANGPDAIRIGVMLPCAAVYGFALAVVGVRLAAKIAESRLPEMCQAALRSAT